MGENAVAPGEGRDNYDGSHKIDTNLLLNEENFISQELHIFTLYKNQQKCLH